jgi:hypothetical protein
MTEAKDWPRTPTGTLRCPCGKPGNVFPQVDTYLGDDLQMFGALGGYCSDECYAKGTATGHPVPPSDTAPAVVTEQPRLF